MTIAILVHKNTNVNTYSNNKNNSNRNYSLSPVGKPALVSNTTVGEHLARNAG